jgi:hypothetical protein
VIVICDSENSAYAAPPDAITQNQHPSRSEEFVALLDRILSAANDAKRWLSPEELQALKWETLCGFGSVDLPTVELAVKMEHLCGQEAVRQLDMVNDKIQNTLPLNVAELRDTYNKTVATCACTKRMLSERFEWGVRFTANKDDISLNMLWCRFVWLGT